ncbi:MAG: thioredoxin family protein [Saprospiraceae bacterium]|nr:thioredoxin family protein [Saprospiraceae bacterium]
MKRFFSLLSVTILIAIGNKSNAEDIYVNFSNANINEARKKAGEEGKLLFIDFHAKWCTPCKWMEQTTFKDEEVAKTLNTDFVAIKVDIDDMQGFELKKMYDVKYLPTILIFNSQGYLVQRIEETLSPRLLLDVLDKHNAPENKVIMRHDFNISPSKLIVDPEIKENDSMLLSEEEYKKYFEQEQTQSSFRVQVGVFERYKGADDMVNTLRQIFLEPINVVNEFRNEVPIFKVRIGQFSTYEEAESFRKILKTEYNMNGIVQ